MAKAVSNNVLSRTNVFLLHRHRLCVLCVSVRCVRMHARVCSLSRSNPIEHLIYISRFSWIYAKHTSHTKPICVCMCGGSDGSSIYQSLLNAYTNSDFLGSSLSFIRFVWFNLIDKTDCVYVRSFVHQRARPPVRPLVFDALANIHPVILSSLVWYKASFSTSTLPLHTYTHMHQTIWYAELPNERMNEWT